MNKPVSRTVSSNQSGPHEKLAEIVLRHRQHRYRRPVAEHSQRAFAALCEKLGSQPGQIIIDSFCGVGESTAALAAANPDSIVIGIDKSAHRLAKHSEHYQRRDIDNYHLVRADTDDFWRLALQQGWKLKAHYLFYPNPWPKSSQLKRRCHGSPLFPALVALGGRIELRSNWPIYVEEFAQALQLYGRSAQVEQFLPEKNPITPFERKYLLSDQALWRCISER